jgi:hypothetical protein
MQEKIVNWNKFDDYRLPTIDEFTDNFEFEYISLVKTEGIVKTIFWTKTKGFEDLTIDRIKQMTEIGYTRVVRDDTIVYINIPTKTAELRNNCSFRFPITVKWSYWSYKLSKNRYGRGYKDYSYETINQKISKMKLYYFYVEGIKSDSNKWIGMGVHSSHPIRQIIVPGYNKDNIYRSSGIYSTDQAEELLTNMTLDQDIYPDESNHHIRRMGKILEINGALYRITGGGCEFEIENNSKYATPFDHVNSKDQVYIFTDYKKEDVLMTDEVLRKQVWMELVNSGTIKKDIPDKLVDSELYKSQHKEIMTKKKSIVPVKDSLGNELFIQGEKDRMYPVTQRKQKQKIGTLKVQLITKSEEELKAASFPPKISYKWSPSKVTKHELSENRLVYVGTMDGSKIKRVYWRLADKLVKKSPFKYKFFSKVEVKKLKKVKLGKSFTPALGDNGIYIPREKSPRKISSNHNDIKTIIEVIPFKDRKDLIKGSPIIDWEWNEVTQDFDPVYGEKCLGKFNNVIIVKADPIKGTPPTYEMIFVPITSDLVITKKVRATSQKKPLRIKKHNGNSNKLSKKDLHNYIVTIDKHIPDKTGTAEFISTVIAPNMEKAINRSYKKLQASVTEVLDFALFKHRSEEILSDKVLIPEKKDSSTRGFLEAKTVVIPRVIKKGVEQPSPLIKKRFDKTSSTIISENIWEFTKWIRRYNPLRSPFKKTKKWVTPIPEVKTKKYLKVKNTIKIVHG